MKTRYRLIRRGNRKCTFYCVDTEAGRRSSLGNPTKAEAHAILAALKLVRAEKTRV